MFHVQLFSANVCLLFVCVQGKEVIQKLITEMQKSKSKVSGSFIQRIHVSLT